MVAFSRPRGLFGASRNSIMPGDQPMLPQGMPQMQGPVGMAPQGMGQPAPQQGGFNAPGGTAEKLFAIGGMLQGDQNAVGQYHAMQQARGTAAQEAQKDALARQAERAEWQWRKEWELAHPAPVNNDTEADYNFILRQQGPEAAAQYLRNIGDPTVTVPLPGNRVYSGPRSGLGGALGGQAAQPQVLGNSLPQGWTVQGGPTQPASGGFPR